MREDKRLYLCFLLVLPTYGAMIERLSQANPLRRWSLANRFQLRHVAVLSSLAAVIGAVAMILSNRTADRSLPTITLDQAFAKRFPTAMRHPIGVVAADSAKIFAWFAGSATGVLFLDQRLIPVGIPGLAKFAGVAFERSGLRVLGVDSSGFLLRAALTNDRDGIRVNKIEAIDYRGEVQGSIRRNDGWLIAGWEHDSSLVVRFVPDNRTEPTESVLTQLSFSRQFFPVAHLGGAGPHATLSTTEFPYHHFFVKYEMPGHLRLVAVPPMGPALIGQGVDSASVIRWSAGPAFGAGRLSIQTLIDTRSDRRLIVILDSLKRPVRRLELDVPVSLIGITEDQKHVLAVRSAGAIEVVGYRWKMNRPALGWWMFKPRRKEQG